MSSCDFVRLTKLHCKHGTKRECRLFKKVRMSWFETFLLSLIFAVEWGRKQKTSPLRTGLWGEPGFRTPQERETGFGPATFSLARRRTTTVLLPQASTIISWKERVSNSPRKKGNTPNSCIKQPKIRRVERGEEKWSKGKKIKPGRRYTQYTERAAELLGFIRAPLIRAQCVRHIRRKRAARAQRHSRRFEHV